MNKIFLLLSLSFFIACSETEKQSSATDSKPSDSSNNIKPINTPDTTKKTWVLDDIEYPGNVAYALIMEKGKTKMAYNVDHKKGTISINGTKYELNQFKHEYDSDEFSIDGNDVHIFVEGTNFTDYENPEPGILKGTAASIRIIVKSDTVVFQNMEFWDGTNAD